MGAIAGQFMAVDQMDYKKERPTMPIKHLADVSMKSRREAY